MKVQKNLFTILIYTLTLFILFILILFVNPVNLVNKMIQLGFWGILILIILYVIDLIIRAFRWKFLLIAQGVHLSIKSLIMPVASALAINLFTVARAGEFARLYALKRNNNTRYSDTLSSIVIEQVLSIFGLLIVITGSLFFLSSSLQQIENSELVQQLITLLFIGSGSILIILSFIMIFPNLIEKIIRFFPPFIETRLLSAYQAFLAGLSDLRSKPSLLFLGILSSTFIWLIEGLMLHMIAFFIFPEFSIIDLPWTILASCAGNITFIIPILPGAIGQYEIVVALVLINSPSYPGYDAALVAFIDRVAKSAILGLLGGYATLQLGGKELFRLRKDFSTLSGDFSEMKKKENSDLK